MGLWVLYMVCAPGVKFNVYSNILTLNFKKSERGGENDEMFMGEEERKGY